MYEPDVFAESDESEDGEQVENKNQCHQLKQYLPQKNILVSNQWEINILTL